LKLSADSGIRDELRAWCGEEGFPRARFASSDRLPAPLRSHPEIATLGAGTFLLVALSCYRREPEDLSVAGDPHGRIAPFARRNYYREAVVRLRRIAGRLGAVTGLSRSELRIFCNSRLPEKALAVAAGLGAYGKNALVLAPGLGSLFVIAGMFVPVPLDPEPGEGQELDFERIFAPGRLCGECRACQDACPVGALPEPGRLDESRCLQALAGTALDLPGEIVERWEYRLYGCQVCQEVCPFNRAPDRETATVRGELGPSLSLRRVLECSPEELADAFRGTALGMSWISKRAILRNALLALGHRALAGFPLDPALRLLLQRYLESRDPLLAHAAAWSAGQPGAGERGRP
jgi:epoxyqueuosine reductase